jgi:hypothetical protein
MKETLKLAQTTMNRSSEYLQYPYIDFMSDSFPKPDAAQ